MEITPRVLENVTESLAYFRPELYIIGASVAILLLGLLLKGENKVYLPIVATLLLLPIAYETFAQLYLKAIVQRTDHTQHGIFYMLRIDYHIIFAKIMFLLATFITLQFSTFFHEKRSMKETHGGEYFALIFSLQLGANLLVASSHWIAFYLSIELLSISSYVLVFWGETEKAREAALKYIIYGSVASAVLLFGVSFMYITKGTLTIVGASQIDTIVNFPYLYYTAILLILGGVFFKVGIVPFHFWVADVYEGSSTPITALFAFLPKVAGLFSLFTLVRFVTADEFINLFVIIASCTIGVGTVLAIWQTNIKRLLAYSSVAHAGYLLIGVIIYMTNFDTTATNSGFFYYVFVYLFMNFAAFVLADILIKQTGSEDIRDYKGIASKTPFVSVLMTFVMLALTGLPPTAGFTAKFFILQQLAEGELSAYTFSLIAVAVIATVISLYFYLKVPYYMYFKRAEQKEIVQPISSSYKWFIFLICLPILAFFIGLQWVLNFLGLFIN